MRVPLIAGNWKMNTTIDEAVNLAQELLKGVQAIPGIETVVCPPFVSLFPVREILSGSGIKLGAQNVYFVNQGAYTGEISPLMLHGLCTYVIIGHSERRQYFAETDAVISQKMVAARQINLYPILCVGENLSEYENGKTEEVIHRQIGGSLEGVEKLDGITIAYEPVWAIGTGKAATGRQAGRTIAFIRSILEERYGHEPLNHLRTLYGGSVTTANIEEFMSEPDIDGALVGGASLHAAEFTGIVKTTARLRRVI